MEKVKAAPARLKPQNKGMGKKLRDLRDNHPLLIMVFPALLIVFLFNYMPIYGVLIAFQDFMPGDKILSDTTIWIGFQNFTRFFTDVQFWPLMKNTFLLCIIGFVIGFPLPIIISLMLNAPYGIIYLSDYAWNNVVHMEPRAQLRVERLDAFVRQYCPAGVIPVPDLQFTMDELNTISNYEAALNDYIRTNLITWLTRGGVSDSDWAAFKADLTGRTHLDDLQKIYQDAYDR